LQTPVKGRARQMRDRGLQGIKAVVERQQSMPSECNDDGLFLDGQDCRSGLLGSCWQVGNGGPRFPLSDRLRVDAVALRKPPSSSLDYVVSLDGPPLSLWRSRVESVP
jgi:hypothetical protein